MGNLLEVLMIENEREAQQEAQKNEIFLELSSLFSLFLFDLNSFFPCFFSIFCFLNQVQTEVLVETKCKSECEPEL